LDNKGLCCHPIGPLISGPDEQHFYIFIPDKETLQVQHGTKKTQVHIDPEPGSFNTGEGVDEKSNFKYNNLSHFFTYN
jgi:hypothetical protein